ncbi:beta-hexosaminidase [Fusarium bulbicola]|nr:beta-hexosaminidase [Fusarium bulbicola]
MHLSLLLSLAFGLKSVVAGPCKPSSFTTAIATTTTDSPSTSSTDTTKPTELSDSTTTTTLAISESTFSSSVSSSAPFSDTTVLSEQTELTGTTTIIMSESTSVSDLSGISVTTSTEVTSTAVSEPSISTSAELTSSIDASITTIESTGTTEPTTATESTGTTEPTTATESTTDSAVPSTQISADTTLEAITTTTTESPTSTTIIEEVSTTTALLPIPTLFTLTAQGGTADGLVIHGNGLPEYSLWIGAFLTWPTGYFKYEEDTGYVSVNGNPLCTISYQGNFDFVSVIVCPTTLSFWHAPLVCDRPTDGSLKCSVATKFYNCVYGTGGTKTCTTTDVSLSTMYSSGPLYASSGTYYQLRFAAADWAHDSTVNPIGLMVSPV